jgi:hypothetical protein
MNGQTVKRLRKKILTDTEEVLIIIRNEYRDMTQEMNPRRIYQAAKKLYKKGKIKL